ncbi:MAG: acetyl-CoA synthetase [Solirubrobacteraceae bacterium]
MSDADVDALVAAHLAAYAGPLRLTDVLCGDHPVDAAAVVAEDEHGARTLTYGELGDRAARLATVLLEAGVRPGDRVAVMLPRSIDLVVAVVAVWQIGAVHVPLFTAFGPDAVAHRVRHCGARVIVVDPRHRDAVGAAAPVLCLGGPGRPGDVDAARGAAGAGTVPPLEVGFADPFVLLYTSGTTGKPKGVPVPVGALAAFRTYMELSVDLQAGDVFWNMSDPGWGYGLWFGVIGTLLLGRRMILRDVPFDPEDTLAAVVRHGVTNLTGAPTAFRALRAARPDGAPVAGSAVRAISTAGEPLNPELVRWSERSFGTAIHDHYGQSEVGMVAGFHHDTRVAVPVAEASMGTALAGFALAVLDADGAEVDDGVDGELAVDVERSPLYWFTGYYRDPEKTAERFRHGPRWYLTGDTVHRDGALLRFTSRADDVITSSGYRIGPFDVESALLAHAAVSEVAVVGVPDALRGEAVAAFVVTREGVAADDALARELREVVRTRLSKHLYPRHVTFVRTLPRTPSGKVRRGELRERWTTEAGTCDSR